MYSLTILQFLSLRAAFTCFDRNNCVFDYSKTKCHFLRQKPKQRRKKERKVNRVAFLVLGKEKTLLYFSIKKKAPIHYLCLSIATSIKPAHHQQESSQLFLIGNEREANYNFVDRGKTNTTENMKRHFITTVLLQLGPN